MCGIFGIIAHGARIPDGVLERGTQSLAHRGPDDSGTILLRDAIPDPIEIGLGNRRLSILDLSPLGHQPMHDAETGNWIVYNGEIYNFREVRAELQQAGTNFVSHSDTEVLLKAYARWGDACLAKFRGMFAFALWDAHRHRLFIARDPMGIKPLYYAHAGSYLIFASEVRTLLGTGLIQLRIDPAGLINYLTFGSAYDPLTIVEGVRSLPPGHTLSWKGGTLQQSSYWDLVDDPATGGHSSEPFAVRNEPPAAPLQPLLEEAVRLQLVSDVPVGVFLSGGIDSSALVSILSRSGITASTFSIVFREADFSEAEYSRAVAARFHTDHHEINVSQSDVLAAIPDALGAMDLPTMDGINTYFVSRETRRAGVKVALSGLGGDEVFAGYSSFRTLPSVERYAWLWKRVPRPVRGSLASMFAALAPESDQNRKLASLARANGRILHPYFLTRMLFTPGQRDLLFPRTDQATARTATASQCDRLQRSRLLDPVNRVSYLESRCYMLNTLLRDADFMSMSQGLEVRVPLIDHRLAKAVLALPGRSKLNGTPKKLLVGALAGSLPEEIVHRPKRGFTLPFEHWMRQELLSEIELVLKKERTGAGPLGGLLDGAQVERVWESFLSGATSWSRPWSLYVLQRWCELHL
ncbi:MAG TPA: asparagine synthase (glutamine-hydrolyzing) [Candidatus Sulfotelmatobacter sp.]|jgi:asparagine synthase (glutamine-hydrolysing)